MRVIDWSSNGVLRQRPQRVMSANKRRLLGITHIAGRLHRLLVIERASKPLRLGHAQPRLLNLDAMVDVERGSDLIRVRASLRPDERVDQRMPKRNPVHGSVLVAGMGRTRPSACFFLGDLQLDDGDHRATQNGPVDAAQETCIVS
jgi:hypothetical protein